jgi:hypothetical protein
MSRPVAFNGKLFGMKRYLLPRLQDILFLGIFAAAVLLGPRMLNMDGDFPRHLAMGRYVLQNGLPPSADVFSYTNSGKPFAPHEWLAGVIFYAVYSLIGLNGIVILAATLLAATFTILYAHAVSRTGIRLPVFFLTVFGAAISSLHWIMRPHLFTMLFLAIWLVLTERLRRGENVKLWLFPALMLFWANLHGEFIAGFLVLGAMLAGWGWDFLFRRNETSLSQGIRLGLVTTFSFLATLVNPVGLRIWTTVIGYVNNSYLISHTNETNPPDFLQPKFMVLLAFLALSVFLLAVKKEPIATGQAFLLAGFSVMSLISARNVHLYGVVAPFVLATTLTGSINVPLVKRFETLFAEIESQLKGAVWPVAIIMLFSISLAAGPQGKPNRFDPSFYPVEAVNWLKANPQPGTMFNHFDWGGYLIFNLWPEKRVFIDSQTDVYGENFTRKYEQVITLTGDWQGILAEYDVQWAIIPPSWPLGDALRKAGWRDVYHDETAVVYSR